MASRNAPYGWKVEIIRHIILVAATFVVILITCQPVAAGNYGWEGQWNPDATLDHSQIDYRK